MVSKRRITALCRFAAVLALSVWLWPLASLAGESKDLAGHWEGEIRIPGPKLSINIDFRLAESGWEGDISIPLQKAENLPLANIVTKGSEVSFGIPGVPGNPAFKGKFTQDGKRISGEFTQFDMTFPFTIQRGVPSETEAKATLEGFDEFAEKALEAWKVPGLAMGIVVEGKVAYAKGFGTRDVEKGLPVTTKTLFAIGSCTKAFTTFLMGTLVDEGKLEWDKPVADFLPGFRLYDDYATVHITPRDLVSHRSGMPRHDLVWYNNLTTSREEMVRRLRYLQPNKEPRERYQYNNLMFTAAGYVAGQVAGTSWEEAVGSRILQPLGMTNSNFSVEDSQKSEDFALPYREKDDKIRGISFRNICLVGPAGSINSCVEDMTKWLMVHLNRGEFQGKRLLKETTCKEMHTPQMVVGVLPSEPHVSPSSYALGWMTDTYRGHYRVHHMGAIDGFVAIVMLFPNDRVGIVALANKTATPLPDLVAHHAADRLLGLERRDWSGEALARYEGARKEEKKAEEKKETVRKTGTKPAHPLKDYAGDYEHPGYGVLKITLEGDHLTMSYNGIVTPLEHWHYEVFNGLENPDDPTFKNMRLSFHANVRGNVDSVSAPFEPTVPEIVFKRRADARLYDAAYLKRFAGQYKLAETTVTIVLKGNVLTANVPGLRQVELVPDLDDEFTVKGMTGVSIRFTEDSEGGIVASIIQPQGVLEVKKE